MKDIYIEVPDYSENGERRVNKRDSIFNLHIKMGDRIYNCYNTQLREIQTQSNDIGGEVYRTCGYLGYSRPMDNTHSITFMSDYVTTDFGDDALDKFDKAYNQNIKVEEKIIEKIVYKEKHIPTYKEILHDNYEYYIMML